MKIFRVIGSYFDPKKGFMFRINLSTLVQAKSLIEATEKILRAHSEVTIHQVIYVGDIFDETSLPS